LSPLLPLNFIIPFATAARRYVGDSRHPASDTGGTAERTEPPFDAFAARTVVSKADVADFERRLTNVSFMEY
jgi:hypothetical protein